MVRNQLQQFRKLRMWFPWPCAYLDLREQVETLPSLKMWFPVTTDLVLGFLEGSLLAEYGLFFFPGIIPTIPGVPMEMPQNENPCPGVKKQVDYGKNLLLVWQLWFREQDSLLAWNGIAQMKSDNICLKWDALISKQQEKQLKLLSWNLSFWTLSKQQQEGGEDKSACAALGDPTLWDLIHFNSVMSPNLPLCGCCKLPVSFTRRFPLLT